MLSSLLIAPPASAGVRQNVLTVFKQERICEHVGCSGFTIGRPLQCRGYHRVRVVLHNVPAGTDRYHLTRQPIASFMDVDRTGYVTDHTWTLYGRAADVGPAKCGLLRGQL